MDRGPQDSLPTPNPPFQTNQNPYSQEVRRPEVIESPPMIVGIEDLGPDDVVIGVMGPVGAGKSAFIRSASGYDALKIGHTLKSCTNEVLAIRYWDQECGRHVVLVDTPGFDDMHKTDLDVLNMIADWLKASYDKNRLLSGILYLHRITDNRMAGTPLRNLRMFQKLCGRDALAKVYLTTTMWDEVSREVGEKRLDELKREYWRTMTDHGAHVACCTNDNDSPKKLIQRILVRESRHKMSSSLGRIPTRGSNRTIGTSIRKKSAARRVWRRIRAIRRIPRKNPSVPQHPPQTTRTSPEKVNIKDLGADDVVIVVMGPTGSGKSTFICTASGYDNGGVGHKLQIRTNQVLAIRYRDQASGRSIVLVDTPGFDPTYTSELSDRDIQNMISDWLEACRNKNILLSGILYLHRITDNRADESQLRNLRKLCGSDALAKLYLTTTMWDEVDREVGEKRLDELKRDQWKSTLAYGAQTARCRSDDGSSKELIQRILAPIEGACSLRLQKEMAERKMDLKETEAGQQLCAPSEALVAKQVELLRTHDRERKAAPQPTAPTKLPEGYSALRDQIEKQQRSLQSKQPLGPSNS